MEPQFSYTLKNCQAEPNTKMKRITFLFAFDYIDFLVHKSKPIVTNYCHRVFPSSPRCDDLFRLFDAPSPT